MTERVSFDEAPGRSPSPGQVVARVGIASIGAANSVVEFEAGQVGLVDSIGYGPLAASTRRGLRHGEQKSFAVLADVDVAGTISAVTKTGGGPTVTCAAISASGEQIAGPWFSFSKLLLTVERIGNLGEARMSFSYDGITEHETIDLSPQLAASLIGTVDLTKITPSGLNTKTFIVDPDSEGPFTTTFSGVSDVNDIVDQVQESMREAATLLGTADLTAYTPGNIDGKTFLATLTVGETETSISVTFASVGSLADIATQIAAATGITSALESGDFISVTTDDKGADVTLTIGNGTANADLGFTNGQSDDGEEYGTAALVAGRYLKVSGKTKGDTGTIEIGNGTANADLGFTNGDDTTGVNSTYDPPGVGVRFTFPAGDYELDTTYAVATVAPKMSVPDFETAAAALRASGEAFAILHVVHEPVDAIDLLNWQTALESFRVECATAEDNPIFFKWILGGPLAPVEDWDDVDTNVKLTLAGTQEANKFNTIVHGDIFVDWEEYSGRHRTQLAHCYVEECARNALNINPGLGLKGALRNAYLWDLEGNRARTEAEALIKLEDHGFSVLRDDKKLPYFRAGRTRAPKTSQFTGEHTARAALECARVMRDVAFTLSNSTPDLTANGALQPVDKSDVEGTFNNALKAQILKPGYASSAKAIITGTESTGGSEKVFVKGVFQRLAWAKDIDITVFVTKDVTIVEGIA
ncbi:MAG: hypothetical protein IPM54_25035 [Polyangiaceae bacterium]|nr:hypothetical protein [Polyangiaceae bacterium]